MQLAELIDHLARRLRTARPEADAEGRYRFAFARGFKLELRAPGRRQLVVEADLRPLPPRPAEAEPVLREALSRSLALLKDRPETLALDVGQSRLVLFRAFELDDLRPEIFERELAGFLAQVDDWRGGQEVRAAPQPAMMLIFP